MSTNQLRSFQLDKKEYPVVSQNDLGAPCCVVSPKIIWLKSIANSLFDLEIVRQ